MNFENIGDSIAVLVRQLYRLPGAPRVANLERLQMIPDRFSEFDRGPLRRDFLKMAYVGTGLLGLPQILQLRAQGAVAAHAKQRALILLWQDGGPSHFETFDPKPDAPSEYRGELEAIRTSLAGVAYCEVLPRLARLAHRTCIVRSLHQPSSDHVVGSHNVLTGWYDQSEGSKSRYPDLGSVISRMRSGSETPEIALGASTDPRLAKGMRGPSPNKSEHHGPAALPRYIDISSGLHRGGPAFLGPIDGPFQVAGDPSKPDFVIQNLSSVGDSHRFQSRLRLRSILDPQLPSGAASIAGFEPQVALDAFRQQAVELLTGGAAARAFDLSRESPEVRERYGRHLAGQQCLLARRLVEAGVSVVAVRFSPDGRGDYDRAMIGWDDHAVHGNIFQIMRQRGPQFDQSLSALIQDLEQRGLTDEVLLVVMGEFGRTPRVHSHKGCPGREHWGAAGCALLYGGGLAMGQVVGSTNAKGEHPHETPISYPSLVATIYQSLGINPAHTFIDQTGRPVPILPTDKSVAELRSTGRRSNRGNSSEPVDAGLIASAKQQTVQSVGRIVVLPEGASKAELTGLVDRTSVTDLLLHDSRIDDAGLALLTNFRSLRKLELNGSPITDAGFVHIGAVATLEELAVTGTRASDAGLVHLRRLNRLRRIEFSGTTISMAGVVRLFVHGQSRSLIEALAAMGQVTFDERGHPIGIHVAGSGIGDEELQHLESHPSLRELHLADTRVTDRTMVCVGQLENLERLHLAKCDITDTGLAHVARLSRLQSINLYGTKISSAGLEYLSGLKQLRNLFVTDVKLKNDAVEQLKRQLPDLKVTDFSAS